MQSSTLHRLVSEMVSEKCSELIFFQSYPCQCHVPEESLCIMDSIVSRVAARSGHASQCARTSTLCTFWCLLKIHRISTSGGRSQCPALGRRSRPAHPMVAMPCRSLLGSIACMPGCSLCVSKAAHTRSITLWPLSLCGACSRGESWWLLVKWRTLVQLWIH